MLSPKSNKALTAWEVSLLFAFSLVNGLMVITLWKDIAYNIAVLALTLLVLQIVCSNGKWLAKRGAWLILTLSSLIPILKRDFKPGAQIWRIKPDYEYFKRIEYVNISIDETNRLRYISPNKLGIAPFSLLPGVKNFRFEAYQQSIRPPLYDYIWRPAFYLYIFLAGVAIASVRAGSWKLLVLAAPILFHSLPFLIMQIPLHKLIHRYHYPVILVGALLSIPLLFTPFRVNGDGDVS